MTISNHVTHFAGKPIKDFSRDEGIIDPAAFAYRLSCGDDDSSDWEEISSAFLNDPQVSMVSALVIGMWATDLSEPPDDVIEMLAASREKLPALKALFVGDITFDEYEISWIQQGDVSPLFLAYPQLEHFQIRGGNELHLGNIHSEHLRSLIVETGGLDRQVVHDIWQSHLPALEHLEIWLGSENYGANTTVDDFAPLLSGDLFPNLRYLGLRDSEYEDELAAAITVSPLLERIKVLDLSLGVLTGHGAQALLDCPAIRTLEKLDVHHHFCSDDVMARLQALPIEVDVSEQQRDGIEDEDERYISVSE